MNLTLNIFNHTFKLACEESQEAALRQAAAKLHQKLLDAKAATPRLETEQLAVLVALEFCQQSILQESQAKQNAECVQLVQQMTHDIETILSDSAVS